MKSTAWREEPGQHETVSNSIQLEGPKNVGFLFLMLLDTNCLATHAKLLHSRVSPEKTFFLFQLSGKNITEKKTRNDDKVQ